MNALLGVTDILELGEAETVIDKRAEWLARWQDIEDLPLAGTSGGVDDRLALLNLTKTGTVLEQQLIIGGGVQTADVDVLVSLDAVFEALLEALALFRGSEYSWNSGRDGRLLLGHGTELRLGDALTLGSDLSDETRNS